jgi:hypothetical protein
MLSYAVVAKVVEKFIDFEALVYWLRPLSLSVFTPMANRYGRLCPSKPEVRLIQGFSAATPCMYLDPVDSEPGGNANSSQKSENA